MAGQRRRVRAAAGRGTGNRTARRPGTVICRQSLAWPVRELPDLARVERSLLIIHCKSRPIPGTYDSSEIDPDGITPQRTGVDHLRRAPRQ
jgi:hypothetical protein